MSGRTDTAIRLVRAAARSAGLGQRTDPELLAAFLAGERDAFEALVRRHGPLVLQACRQATRCEADAEDAFQATFVQLYQRAASIRSRPSLAGWLFRVARRSAANARRAALRRERREARTESRSDSTTDLSWREACAVLHEELDRLPDAYRLPLILCYLQGLSRDEAARRLGLTLDTVRGRLDRGRARLRARLLKRGISLSTGLFSAVATPAVPAGLIPRTLAAARTASPTLVSGLAWKAACALALAATVVLGVVIHDRGVHAQPAKPAPDRPAAKKKPEATKSVTVSGRVLDPDGKPVAGAKVYVRQSETKEVDPPSARTDADGRFTVAVPAADAEARTSVVAAADGFAAGWQTWTGEPPDSLTLTLAKDDVLIRGRILDLEGKPLAGATLTVKAVHAFPEAGPKAYLEWLSGLRSRPVHNTLLGAPPGPAEVVTAADGTFRLTGIGRDRAVHLAVTGPGIAYESIYPVTVPALGVKPTARTGNVYPATFDHLAAPARPIRGTVRDAATAKPLPGLRVNGYGGAAVVTTDADGRYELPGYKKGPKYTVYVRPADGSEYFPAQAEAADRAGLDPLVIDLKVQPGIPVSGFVREKSGKPVAGTVRYFAFAGNPNVGQIPVGDFHTQEVAIRPDGGFKVAVLPGPGFLGIKARGHYPAARVDPDRFFFLEDLDLKSRSDPDLLKINVGGGAASTVRQEGYQEIVLLNVKKDKPPPEQKIHLTPAEPVRGRLLDPDGKPLAGVRVRGLREAGEDWSAPLASAEFTAAPPHLIRPRRLAFRHDGRKLVGTADLSAGSAEPVEFKLEPWATVTGRLLDGEGKPIAGASVFVPAGDGKDGKTVDGVRIGAVVTDVSGRFRIDALSPAVAYKLMFREMKPTGRIRSLTKLTSLNAGEVRDLGDLKVSPREP